jgi:predicted nucleic acid-binding protein
MQPILIDTNVLVYVFDQNEPTKQARSAAILPILQELNVGRLSAQTLAEFCAVVIRRLRPPLTASEAVSHVESYANSYPVLPITSLVVLEAARGVRDHQFSYYDAQIWAIARLNQISIVFSEDFNPSTIEGVRFVNPFAADFVLEQWL